MRLTLLLLVTLAVEAAEMITLQPGADDGAAITQALAKLKQAGGGTLTLSAGRYHLSSSAQAAVIGQDLAGVSIVGQDAVLVGTRATRLFGFANCRGLTLRKLRIAWEPLPYTVGTVTAQDVGFHGVELTVAAPYRAEAGRLTQAVMGWDLVHARTSADGWETYQCNGERPEPSTITAAGRLLVPIQRHAKLPAIGGAGEAAIGVGEGMAGIREQLAGILRQHQADHARPERGGAGATAVAPLAGDHHRQQAVGAAGARRGEPRPGHRPAGGPHQSRLIRIIHVYPEMCWSFTRISPYCPDRQGSAMPAPSPSTPPVSPAWPRPALVGAACA